MRAQGGRADLPEIVAQLLSQQGRIELTTASKPEGREEDTGPSIVLSGVSRIEPIDCTPRNILVWIRSVVFGTVTPFR